MPPGWHFPLWRWKYKVTKVPLVQVPPGQIACVVAKDGAAWRAPDGKPHFKPKAKTVIWFFMIGGTSHMESFDPKPELTHHAGKTIAQSPYKSTLDSPFVKQNVREVIAGLHKVHPTIYPL